MLVAALTVISLAKWKELNQPTDLYHVNLIFMIIRSIQINSYLVLYLKKL